MLEPTGTNKALRFLGNAMIIISIIVAIVIIFKLKHQEPDTILPLTGSVIEGDEVAHPLRWVYAFATIVAGIINSLFMFAISEVLTRLQEIQYNSKKTTEYHERLKASS